MIMRVICGGIECERMCIVFSPQSLPSKICDITVKFMMSNFLLE